MTVKMESKSGRILTSVKLWFLIPLPCEINIFTVKDPSKNGAKSIKKNSATRPPQNPQFSTSGRLWMATWAEKPSKRVPSEGGREHQKQFQKGPKVRPRTDSSKRTEFFSKWVLKCIPKAISFSPNPLERGLSKCLEWNKLGEVTHTFYD